MRCDEARPLQWAYLDSELDARTTLEIEQHLKECAECRRLFTEEAEEEARIRHGLNRGEKTPALWEQIERSVTAAPLPASAARTLPGTGQSIGWRDILGGLGEQVQAGWRRSRWVWSGMAAAWVAILSLNLAARGPERPPATAKRMPAAAEVRLALEQKRLLTADLGALPEAHPATKEQAAPKAPRSERSSDTLSS